MNGVKIILILTVSCVIYNVFCLVKRWLFIRSHKVRSNCGHKIPLWKDQ